MRLDLINQFMSWAYWKESDRWTEANNEERIIVKRHFMQWKVACGFGLAFNFATYQAFFTGIYNWRTKELLNMKHVPWFVKLGASVFVSY
jgi:hypothetical protein